MKWSDYMTIFPLYREEDPSSSKSKHRCNNIRQHICTSLAQVAREMLMRLAWQGPLIHMLANAKLFVTASSLLFFTPLITEVVHICPLFLLYTTFEVAEDFTKVSEVTLDNQVWMLTD